MQILRNVHDPIPVNFSNAQIAAFAAMLRERLGIRDAAGLQEAFVHLGGIFEGHFNMPLPAILVRGPSDILLQADDRLERANQAIGEALGTLFLHHPLVMRDWGEDAMTAVSAVEDHPEPHRDATLRERVVFAVHLGMPADDFRAAFGRDPSVLSLAREFMVSPRNAAFRCKGLGLEPTEVPDWLRDIVWREPTPARP